MDEWKQTACILCECNCGIEVRLGAKVVDVAPDAVTIEVTGNAGKLRDFLAVIEPFGLRELVQSGMVAIGRGGRSITERTLRPVPVPPPATRAVPG